MFITKLENVFFQIPYTNFPISQPCFYQFGRVIAQSHCCARGIQRKISYFTKEHPMQKTLRIVHIKIHIFPYVSAIFPSICMSISSKSLFLQGASKKLLYQMHPTQQILPYIYIYNIFFSIYHPFFNRFQRIIAQTLCFWQGAPNENILCCQKAFKVVEITHNVSEKYIFPIDLGHVKAQSHCFAKGIQRRNDFFALVEMFPSVSKNNSLISWLCNGHSTRHILFQQRASNVYYSRHYAQCN